MKAQLTIMAFICLLGAALIMIYNIEAILAWGLFLCLGFGFSRLLKYEK